MPKPFSLSALHEFNGEFAEGVVALHRVAGEVMDGWKPFKLSQSVQAFLVVTMEANNDLMAILPASGFNRTNAVQQPVEAHSTWD
jgi:hypothetical protein